MINVADALDPEFMQPVTRVQRAEVVNQYGETTVTSTSTTIQAVCTSPSKTGMMRFDDAQTYQDTIQVTTLSPLNGPTVGGQPDLIVYKGQTFVVAIVNDYQSFGYTRAVCKLTDLQDVNNG
ncbi:MAG: hypothetical protein H5T98_01050 [Syntrophomonadaceae bacterium]|nr:hypothetical protein [Syntrophomonadaceae bacterium]